MQVYSLLYIILIGLSSLYPTHVTAYLTSLCLSNKNDEMAFCNLHVVCLHQQKTPVVVPHVRRRSAAECEPT